MIRLPNTGTYSLELITAQNGAQSVVSYSDATSSAYTGGTQVASITSATTTTICSTPAASTVRDVDQINVKNTFAGSHTVTVQVDANGTNYPLIVAALLTDESLNYTHGSGWQVKDANGNTKNSALTSMTSAQLAAILTDETGSGALVFATSPTLVTPALGTPSSGTVTNLTGTASININGTVGATTPAAGTFTTLTSTGNATLGDAEATDTHAIKGATTLLANSASAALTVTQTGAGNAFVVVGNSTFSGNATLGDASGDTVTVHAGTAALPTIIPSGDPNTGIWFPAADTVAVSTAGSERTRIDSAGNVGIGSSTIESFGGGHKTLELAGSSTTEGGVFKTATSDSAGAGSAGTEMLMFTDSTGGKINVVSSDPLILYTANAERMRIDSSGVLRLLSTGAAYDSTPGTGTYGLHLQADSTGLVHIDSYSSGGTTQLAFGTNTGGAAVTEKLRIASDGTTTLGGTSTAPALSVVPVASQVNWVKISPAATGVGATITTDGEATVPLLHNTKGGAYQSFLTNSFEQVRVTHTASATRYITLTGATGSNNPTISTSAGALALGNGQLQFPATQNASSDANTLDDYEEGTWTPVLTFATTGDLSVAYTTQVASYTKIGNTVRLCWNIATSTFTHTTASGNLQIGTIPFAGANVTGLRHYGSVQVNSVTKANYTQICPYVEVNDSTLRFQAWGSGQAVSNVAAADMPTGGSPWIRGTLVYQTA